MPRQRKTSATLFQPFGRAHAPARGAGPDTRALEAIWEAVSAIPRGQVATYGTVARAASLPGRARQVGYALRIADASLSLPWHRVVAAGGRIAFPAGSRAYREQARLLRAEGVRLQSGRVVRSALTDLS